MINLDEKLKSLVETREIDGEKYAKISDITHIIKQLARSENMSKLVAGVMFNNDKKIEEVFASLQPPVISIDTCQN